MDQRDQLISKMAEQVGVTIRPGDSGTVDVFMGGTAIVRGNRAVPLKWTSAPTRPRRCG